MKGLDLPTAVAMLLTLAGRPCAAQEPGQRTFPSPEAAVAALCSALQGQDEKAILAILGPGSKALLTSGDREEDARDRAEFLGRYQEMHRLERRPDGTVELVLGAANWPSPIPLVNRGEAWFFDAEAGGQELLLRRIGQNEWSTLTVLRELVMAQKEYFAGHRGVYARSLCSSPGHQDGLYWKTGAGEPESPIGPALARAEMNMPPEAGNTPAPYCGYYYATLGGQGHKAPGGAKDYGVNGRMSGGFAFLAFPAEYRTSGVMTFMVNLDGDVVEKDLGPTTLTMVQRMKRFDPDATWEKVP